MFVPVGSSADVGNTASVPALHAWSPCQILAEPASKANKLHHSRFAAGHEIVLSSLLNSTC